MLQIGIVVLRQDLCVHRIAELVKVNKYDGYQCFGLHTLPISVYCEVAKMRQFYHLGLDLSCCNYGHAIAQVFVTDRLQRTSVCVPVSIAYMQDLLCISFARDNM